MEQNVQTQELDVHEKLRSLQDYLAELGSVVVAFSGGVDSTFLAAAAHDVLGDKMLAVTAASPSFPERERRDAVEFCRERGIPHRIVEYNELSIPGFSHNPKNRCYLCKHGLFEILQKVAQEGGYACVAEGSNMDDMGDYRPGLMAVKELGVKSPLRHARMTKQDIRDLSKEMGLPTWDKPAFACLASRFVYGEDITEEKLAKVGKAEQFLVDHGFRQMRVRIHGKGMARIEILPEDFPRIMEPSLRQELVAAFKEYGFNYVTLDLQGYRTGSMNETLKNK